MWEFCGNLQLKLINTSLVSRVVKKNGLDNLTLFFAWERQINVLVSYCLCRQYFSKRDLCGGIGSCGAHVCFQKQGKTNSVAIMIVFVKFILYSMRSSNRKDRLRGTLPFTCFRLWSLVTHPETVMGVGFKGLILNRPGNSSVECIALHIPFDLEMIWDSLMSMHPSGDGIACPNFLQPPLILENMSSLK